MKQNKGCDFFDDDEELKAVAKRKARDMDEDLGDDSIFQPVSGEDGRHKAPPAAEERMQRPEPRAYAPAEPPVRQPVRGIPVERTEPKPYTPEPARPAASAPVWEAPKPEQTSFAREMEMKRETPEIKQPVRETPREPAPQSAPRSKVVRLRFFWYEKRQAYSSSPYPGGVPQRTVQPVHEAPRPAEPPAHSAEPMKPVYTPEPAPVAPYAAEAPARGRDAATPAEESPYAVSPLATTDARILSQLLEIEQDAYGEEGMNKWDVVPFIRYGRVFGLMEGRNAVKGAAYFMRDWEAPDRAYLVNVALRRDLRGREVGTFLLKESFLQLRKEGVKRVELTVDPSNTYAISVYREQMGFYENGRRRNEYGDGEDRLIMDTDLKK